MAEQSIVENEENTAGKMQELAGIGVDLVLHHFGAGFPSLNMLKLISVRRIKIDRSFISGIPSSQNDRAIIKAMIAMAHTIGVTVVAEGVETREQLRFLKDNGCDEIQGYYVSAPKSPDEFSRFASTYRLS